jgi:tripartite-type tricarboxylate transporter receptor subunit TctC
VKERLAQLGAEPAKLTPEEFGRYVKGEVARWAKVVKESGARLD